MTNDITLTGVWDGLYSYTHSGQLESIFTAVLFQTGAGLSGTIHETMRRRHAQDLCTSAFVDGSVDGRRVSFSKTYDGSGGQTHVVVYEGRLGGDEIEGVWTIPSVAGNTGRFLMIRGRNVESRADKSVLEKI